MVNLWRNGVYHFPGYQFVAYYMELRLESVKGIFFRLIIRSSSYKMRSRMCRCHIPRNRLFVLRVLTFLVNQRISLKVPDT